MVVWWGVGDQRTSRLGAVRERTERWSVRVGSRNRFVRHLAGIPVLAKANRRTLTRVARWGDVISVEAGDVLAREDRSNRWFFLILSGAVKVTHRDRHVATLRRGGHFGEIAVVGFRPQPATVTAVEHSVLFVLGRRHLVSVAAMDPAFQRALFPDVVDYTAFVRTLHEEGRREWERLGPYTSGVSRGTDPPMRPPGRRLSLTEAAEVLTRRDVHSDNITSIPARRPPNRRTGVALSVVVGASLLAFALLYHPSLAIVSPARPIDVTSDVTISGGNVDEPTGRYVLTAANVDRPNLLRATIAWVTGRRVVGVRPREPGDVSENQRVVHDAFLESQRQAIALAKRSLGGRAQGLSIVIRDRGIGGPSAGLVYALAIIDMIDGRDLARGRVVAATGELDRNGRVRDVGYLEMKRAVAADADADVFIVPASQARSAASPDVRVIGVRDLADAVGVLLRRV